MFKLLSGAICVLVLVPLAEATAQSSSAPRPALPATKSPPPASGPAEQSPAGPQNPLQAAEACRVAIATETVLLKRSLQVAYVSLERWQALLDQIEQQSTADGILKAAQDRGIAAADVDKLKEAKEATKMKEIAAAQADAARKQPEAVVDEYKKRVEKVCKAIHEQLKADMEIVAAQTKAETEAMICDQKIDTLQTYLELRYGRVKAAQAAHSARGTSELEIVSARMGEFSERQTCDAWAWVRKVCADAAQSKDATKPADAGPTYCIIRRDQPKIEDFCGYDPAPRESKQVVVSYRCGGPRLRQLAVPALSKFIRFVCEYPGPPAAGTVARPNEQELEKMRAFLVEPPCAVTGLKP